MTPFRLRAIPSVDQIARALGDTGLPRPIVLSVVRRELAALRSQKKNIPQADEVLARIRGRLQEVDASRIRPVINGTGILVHTNLGRAPLGAHLLGALSTAAANNVNQE
jgi:L-seryl-tRNA(Ser) seleniumtransferase